MSLSQQANISQSYTANTNLLEVAFSPQDEVNDDINSSLGYFNIGEYIGDPRLRSSSAESYPSLDTLRDSYFQKYTKNYNLVDFVRLIKFFDNSLFKMIKDFVPARTSLASGIVIKQHILERNKVPQPQVDTNSTIAYYTSGSTKNKPLTFQDISVSGTLLPQWNDYNAGTVENFGGGTAGVFEMFNGTAFAPSGSNIFNLTQSWSELIQIASGSVNVIHNSQDEFYNGEFEGSTLTITTQSLNTPFLNDVIDFSYTPVIYAPNLYSGNTFINPVILNDDNVTYQFTQDQFLNNLTVPAQGEILLLDNFRIKNPSYDPTPFAYVKIHKIDNNNINNGVALGQAIILRIKFTMSNGHKLIGDIVEVTEYPTYYLYKVQKLDFIYFNEANNYIKNYTFSGSRVSSFTISGLQTSLLLTASIDNANVHSTSSGFSPSSSFTYSNTPNIRINFTASFTGKSTSAVATASLQLYFSGLDDILTYTLPNFPISTSPEVTRTITGSIYPLNASPFIINAYNVGFFSLPGVNVSNVQFQLTQSNGWSISTSPTASVSCSLIIEPYITENNFFYNSNNNALLNSVNDQRKNSFALDVDYGYGITPINFSLLISGTAIPATVPDSNYTSKKSTILKYEGSKSTSQLLNQWTQGDIGTYGKLPTVESLKTYIAYCDGINGWPPEHENASAMNVLYLIKADGTVVIPNTSQDSLSIMQQTFQTGERVFIRTKNGSTSPLDPYRTVIRGGSHIEPILYTQYGQLPGVNFNTTMSFEDIALAPGGATANYAALYKPSASLGITPNTETIVPLNIVLYGAAIGTLNSYDVTSACVQDGVDLTFILTPKVVLSYGSGSLGGTGTPPGNINIIFNLYKNSITSNNTLSTNTFGPYTFQNGQYAQGTYVANPTELTFPPLTYTLSSANLNTSDKIFATVKITHNVSSTQYINFFHSLSTSPLQVSQYPIFTPPVTSSGYNTIWGYGNKTTHPYIITSSQTTLVELYENPNVKAKDITGSGFNSIQLPWKINYGDEFKFEGREDWSYMVKNIYAPAESGSGRIFQTGSIEVHFNANLPVSASSSVFNLDHFLIRRYVDDAAQNIITGFRPPGSTGPYLIKPEFVVPELNKSIDEVILDLTQKGLIT
jgi:hypothetical protein